MRALALALAASLAAPVALGAPPEGGGRAATAPSPQDRAKALGLYDQGVSAFKAGDHREADRLFQEAYRLDPSPILLYNLARAAEERGDAPLAITRYRRYLRDYPKAEDRAAVERQIRILDNTVRKAKQGGLLLEGAPAGSRFYVDDTPMSPPGAAGWELDPGEYTVRVEPLEGRIWQTRVEITTGQTETVRYDPHDPGSAPGPGGLAIAKYTAAGVALAAGAVGLVFTSQARAAVDDYAALSDRIGRGDGDIDALGAELDDAGASRDQAATWSYVMYGVAGIAAAGAVALFLLDADAAGPEGSALQVQVGPGVVGLSGRF